MGGEGMDTNYNTALTTLALLEERLNRISYLLHGDPSSPQSTPTLSTAAQEPRDQEDFTIPTSKPLSATDHLHKLERALASLAAKSPTVTDILDLHKQHPSLFHPSTEPPPAPDIPPQHLAALILSHAPLYTTTSTSLQHLSSHTNTTDPLPPAHTLANLTTLTPRIRSLQTRQQAQAREVADLRARSARVVEKWYEDGVLGMGEKWAEWDEGLREGEILVRRAEARRRREEGEGGVV